MLFFLTNSSETLYTSKHLKGSSVHNNKISSKYESIIETMKMINILFRRQSKSFTLIAVKSAHSRVDSKNDYNAAKKEPPVNVPLDFTSSFLFSHLSSYFHADIYAKQCDSQMDVNF